MQYSERSGPFLAEKGPGRFEMRVIFTHDA
jgi:hypothetical protein